MRGFCSTPCLLTRRYPRIHPTLRLPIVWEPREPAMVSQRNLCWQMEQPKIISEDSLWMQSFQNHMKTSYIYRQIDRQIEIFVYLAYLAALFCGFFSISSQHPNNATKHVSTFTPTDQVRSGEAPRLFVFPARWGPKIDHGPSYRQSQWEFQDPKMEVLYHILGTSILGS